MCKEVEIGSRFKSIAGTTACSIEVKSFVLLQVNSRSICNKALEFWNLDDTYNSDVVINTESF